jgi:hypothetical protein
MLMIEALPGRDSISFELMDSALHLGRMKPAFPPGLGHEWLKSAALRLR